MLAFNILDHLKFQLPTQGRLTRNREKGLRLIIPRLKLESSSQFYPARLARLWNSMHIDIRTKLVSPAPLSQVKSLLNSHYRDKLINFFDPENVCTYVSVCQCTHCRL